jgi:predicted protein tyrosine phosphatase
MGKIIICRAEEMIEAVKTHGAVAVLSIEHPASEVGEGRAPRVADHGLAVEQKILCYWDTEDTAATGCPDRAQVEEGIVFVAEWLDRGDVIVHCHAGISRSAAQALGALAHKYPQRGAEELVEEVRAIRSIAAPNMLVLEHADAFCGRGGALLDAVRTHPVLSFNRARTDAARERWLKTDPEALRHMYPEKFPKP